MLNLYNVFFFKVKALIFKDATLLHLHFLTDKDAVGTTEEHDTVFVLFSLLCVLMVETDTAEREREMKVVKEVGGQLLGGTSH